MSPLYKSNVPASSISAPQLTGLSVPRVSSDSDHRACLADLKLCSEQEQITRILVARRMQPADLGAFDGRDYFIPYIAQASAATRMEILEQSLATKSPDRHGMIRAVLLSCWNAGEVRECVGRIPKAVRFHASLQPAISLARFVAATQMFEPLLEARKSREPELEPFCTLLARLLVQGGEIVKDASKVVDSDYVRPMAGFLRAGLTIFTQMHDPKPPSREKIGLMQSFLNTVETFQKYGVLFLNGIGRRPGYATAWKVNEVGELSEVLNRIPGWVLWGTPLLCAIVRRGESPYGFHASRIKNGDIEINEGVFVKSERSPYLPGWSTAQIALCHEIGHAIHFAHRYDLQLKPDGTIAQSGNRAIDFPRYADLSGWRVIRRCPQLIRDNQYALLSGFEVPLDTSLDDGMGQRVQFSYDQYAPKGRPLWAHNPDAGFPFGSNAHTSPWEDFADSFAMYVLAPSEFRALAPVKSAYFEELLWKPATSEERRASHTKAEICSPQALRRILSQRRGAQLRSDI